MDLCPGEKDGYGVPLALARAQFLRPRWHLFAVGWDGAAENPGHRRHKRCMGDFLARTQRSLKNPSPETAYLTPKIR